MAGGAIILLYISYMVAQYVAGARVLEAVLGVPYLWGAVGFAVTVGLYTAYGGFRAVAWTDAFQAVVMLFGVLIAAWFALEKIGGFEGVERQHRSPRPGTVDAARSGRLLAAGGGGFLLRSFGRSAPLGNRRC